MRSSPASIYIVLPWPKKRTIIEIRGEKNAVPRVISCLIRRDQRRASSIRDCPRLLPCADRAWSSMISHVEQCYSRRESRGWFFFLSRIVLVSRSINMLSVTDFVPKGIISGVRVQAGLHLDMLEADRSPNMQSAFLPELHRWISKLIARHLHACPPGDLLITMVKEMVIFYKKEFRKMKKSRIFPWSERDESAIWLRDCLWLCQACKRGFTCRPM